MSKIDFINPILNLKTRTIEVRATLKNKNNFLKPGMIIAGKVHLKKATNNKRILLPKSAVLWTGKRSIVYVKTKKDEPVFELREVTLGADLGTSYEIISGLKTGEEVVSKGTFTVDATAQLQGKKSMMSPQEKEENTPKSLKKISVNKQFKKQLNTVFNDYLAIKNALTKDDISAANKGANKALSDVQKVQMKLLKNPEAHTVWMKELKALKTSFANIKSAKDLATQRTEFIKLSSSIITLANVFGVTKTLYVTHCSMANNNKGADWLSEFKEIKNPFFGSKMLTCGNTKQILKSNL